MQKLSVTERTARAIANGMRIRGDGKMTDSGNRFWIVTSEDKPGVSYIVEDTGGQLQCNCPATVGCKHICLVGRRLTEEWRAARAAKIAATAATPKAAPVATAAEKRERALPAWATDNRAFSIFKS